MTAPSISGAAFAGKPTELTLKDKRRNLNLDLRGPYLYAALSLPGKFRMLAYCSEKIADCYLHEGNSFHIWLGGTAFDVSAVEAQKINSVFGLRFETFGKSDAQP